MAKRTVERSFSTLEALAAAVAAFQTAGNRVVRYNESDVWSNGFGCKEVVDSWLTDGSILSVTEAHREQAQEIQSWLSQKMTLSVLSNQQLSGFFVDVCSLLQNENINQRKLGMLVWAPKLYNDMNARDNQVMDIRLTCQNSKCIGQIGKPITLTVQVMDTYYMRDFMKWRTVCADNQGNLVQFYHSEKLEGTVNIKARVKSHAANNRFYNVPMTQLNYAKKIA